MIHSYLHQFQNPNRFTLVTQTHFLHSIYIQILTRPLKITRLGRYRLEDERDNGLNEFWKLVVGVRAKVPTDQIIFNHSVKFYAQTYLFMTRMPNKIVD